MSKPSQTCFFVYHPHPPLRLINRPVKVSLVEYSSFCLWLIAFGTQLAAVWFSTSIMMVALFTARVGRLWLPVIRSRLLAWQHGALLILYFLPAHELLSWRNK